jgi:hypothetical protein
MDQADYAAARPVLEEGLQLALALKDRYAIAKANARLAWLDFYQQAYEVGRRRLEESLAIAKAHDDQFGIGYALLGLAFIDFAEGHYGASLGRLKESLLIWHDRNDNYFIIACLEGFGRHALADRSVLRAVRLWGAAAALRTAYDIPGSPADELAFGHYLTTARSLLEADVWAAAWAEGQVLALDEAIAYALEEEPCDA